MSEYLWVVSNRTPHPKRQHFAIGAHARTLCQEFRPYSFRPAAMSENWIPVCAHCYALARYGAYA